MGHSRAIDFDEVYREFAHRRPDDLGIPKSGSDADGGQEVVGRMRVDSDSKLLVLLDGRQAVARAGGPKDGEDAA